MSKYLIDTDPEFEEWWEKNDVEFNNQSGKNAARMAFEAGANTERCEHNTTTMAKSRDWCHDCHTWVHRKDD